MRRSRLNPVQELSRQKILRVQELPGEAERSTLHSLGSGKSSLITWSSPEAKHDKGKMIKPVRTSQASAKKSFQEMVEKSHKVDRLRMETGSLGTENIQKGT